MIQPATDEISAPRPTRWSDPVLTADGLPRAWTPLRGGHGPGATTLWFDVGLGGGGDDALAPLSRRDVSVFLDEVAALGWPTRRVVFMGRRAVDAAGAAPQLRRKIEFDHEPLLRRDVLALVEETLARGFETAIATAADAALTKRRVQNELLALRERYGARLRLEIALAHHTERSYDAIRGAGGFDAAMIGLAWAAANNFGVRVVGGVDLDERVAAARRAYKRLFERNGVALDAGDPELLSLTRAAEPMREPPEIASSDWTALGVSPTQLTCASARAVIKRSAEAAPRVVACPFILDDPAFELGDTLAASERPVTLKHRRCAALCVFADREETGASVAPRRRRPRSPGSHAEVC